MKEITERLDELKKRDYELFFRRESSCLFCDKLNILITPDQFEVDESYHFEYTSSPDRDRKIYAISTTHGYKGLVVDACLVYEDNISNEISRRLQSGKKKY